MEYKNRLTDDFERQIGSFKDTWPSASAFLDALRCNKRGFWLNEVKNAHSFYKDRFIAYVKLGGTEMELSPRFHIRIPEGKHDSSDILFSKIDSLIMKHDGIARRWAFLPFDGSGYTICKPAPQEFFDDVIKTIEDGYQAIRK